VVPAPANRASGQASGRELARAGRAPAPKLNQGGAAHRRPINGDNPARVDRHLYDVVTVAAVLIDPGCRAPARRERESAVLTVEVAEVCHRAMVARRSTRTPIRAFA
jgi:hypothetical protein